MTLGLLSRVGATMNDLCRSLQIELDEALTYLALEGTPQEAESCGLHYTGVGLGRPPKVLNFYRTDTTEFLRSAITQDGLNDAADDAFWLRMAAKFDWYLRSSGKDFRIGYQSLAKATAGVPLLFRSHPSGSLSYVVRSR